MAASSPETNVKAQCDRLMALLDSSDISTDPDKQDASMYYLIALLEKNPSEGTSFLRNHLVHRYFAKSFLFSSSGGSFPLRDVCKTNRGALEKSDTLPDINAGSLTAQLQQVLPIFSSSTPPPTPAPDWQRWEQDTAAIQVQTGRLPFQGAQQAFTHRQTQSGVPEEVTKAYYADLDQYAQAIKGLAPSASTTFITDEGFSPSGPSIATVVAAIKNPTLRAATMYRVACFGEACTQLASVHLLTTSLLEELTAIQKARNKVFHDKGTQRQGRWSIPHEMSIDEVAHYAYHIASYNPNFNGQPRYPSALEMGQKERTEGVIAVDAAPAETTSPDPREKTPQTWKGQQGYTTSTGKQVQVRRRSEKAAVQMVIDASKDSRSTSAPPPRTQKEPGKRRRSHSESSSSSRSTSR